MDDYAGRVLAGRYRLPSAPVDEFELVETRAFDSYSGQEVLVRQLLLPEIVSAEVEDGEPAAAGPGHGGDSAERALRAARAAAAVPDHARLVQVFDVLIEDGSLWVVSELVPTALPVAALLAREPLGPYRVAEIAADLLTGVRALHAHGWAHRNITAHTVLVCEDGRAMLDGLAFGAAQDALCGYDPVPQEAPAGPGDEAAGRQEWGGPQTPLAQDRARQARLAVVGPVTERWSPEQALSPVPGNWQLAPPIGPATDLWALGALLFRCVRGHAPFPEENAAELVRLVCSEPSAPAEGCGPLRPVVESLLRQDPDERPEFEEVRGWLRSLVRSAPEPDVGVRTVQVPSGPADPHRLPIVRRKGELVRQRRKREKQERREQRRREKRQRSADPPPTAERTAVPAAPPVERPAAAWSVELPAAWPVERAATPPPVRSAVRERVPDDFVPDLPDVPGVPDLPDDRGIPDVPDVPRPPAPEPGPFRQPVPEERPAAERAPEERPFWYPAPEAGGPAEHLPRERPFWQPAPEEPAGHGRHARGGPPEPPDAVGPARPAADPPRRRPRRLGLVMVGLVLVALAGLVGYAMTLAPRHATGSASPLPAGVDSGGTQEAGSAPPSRTPSPTASAVRSTAPALAVGFALRHDPAGFTLAVHDGWGRAAGPRGETVFSSGGDALRLVVVRGRDAASSYGSDPIGYETQKEPELADFRASSWASSSGLKELRSGGLPAAEGQFSWRDPHSGRQLYALNLVVLRAGHYDIVELIGPDDQRALVSSYFQQSADTFRATG